MNKNKFAITPPMGWNSYDYYDTTVNEEQIKNALEELAKNHTIMTIAHRLNTIENAECIYVLQKGRIVQKGTHRELMDSEGVYSRLYRMSSEEEADA